MGKTMKKIIASLLSVFIIMGVVMSTTTVANAMPAAIRVNYFRYTYTNSNGKSVSKHFRQMYLYRYENKIYKITSNSNIYDGRGNKIGYSAAGNYLIRADNKIYLINGKRYYYVQKVQKLNELYVSDKPLRTSKKTTGFVRIENVGKLGGGQYIIGQTSWGEKFNTQMPMYNICKSYNVTKVTKFWLIEPPMCS